MALLVLTIGNSDVQLFREQIEKAGTSAFGFSKEDSGLLLEFANKSTVRLNGNRNYPDWLILKNSRLGGEVLLENIKEIMPYLHFPLIAPVINFLINLKIQLKTIVFVFTDQSDEKFRSSDTIFTAALIKGWLGQRLVNVKFEDISIDHVTDIDSLYPKFKQQVRKWRTEFANDTSIFLADQGGVDQINQSIRLQLLQEFKGRVHILQKAEGADAKMLAFPQLFINDLNKQNILKHVRDFDFDKIDDTLQPESWVVKLCSYAANRLALQHQKILPLIEELNKAVKATTIQSFPEWHWNKMPRLERNKIVLRDLYIAAKIQFLNKRYNEFVWRIFTVYENLLREPFDNLIAKDSLNHCYNPNTSKDNKNEKWMALISQIDEQLIGILQKENIHLNNPNRKAYSLLFKTLTTAGRIPSPLSLGEIEVLEMSLDKLSGKRNGIVHNMGNATLTDMDINFKSLEAPGFRLLDKWFNISEMGDFSIIQKEILDRYD